MTAIPAQTGAGLLIRLWAEGDDADGVRARLYAFHGTDDPASVATAGAPGDVVRLVTQWVEAELRVLQDRTRDTGTDGTEP